MSILTSEDLKAHRNKINPIKTIETLHSDNPKQHQVAVKKRRNNVDFNLELARLEREFKEYDMQ